MRDTGLMWANMLRAFQVGKALTSDGEPSIWMRFSRVAWAQVKWIREPVSAERVTHRPQGHKGVEVLGSDLEPTRTPLAQRLADREEFVARSRELVVMPAPIGLRRGLDDTEPFELPEPL